MPDYGHDLRFGSFLTPSQANPEAVVGLAQLSEELGLDLVTFQDHPYQPGYLDTWTLLSYVAAATVQIKIAPNVLNLPLRPPAVIARSVASLDLLSGGRFELGLGAGAFWDAIEAMGGTRLTPGESVVALDEAITIIRDLWDVDSRGGVTLDGERYQVRGAKRGPAPAHDVEIWLGALKPRILRLTGRRADGWLPSSAYLPPDGLADANAVIDGAAHAAGRRPEDVRRLYNITGRFSSQSAGFLDGPVGQWVEQLTELTVRHGMSTFILASDDPQTLSSYANEVVVGVREAVAAARADAGSTRASSVVPPATPTPAVAADDFPVRATPMTEPRLAAPLWDEETRPNGPPRQPGRTYSSHELAGAQQLVDIHSHLRGELDQIRDLVSQVLSGGELPARARSAISEMTVRQNNWTVGAYCASYCRLVTTHHSIEDSALFPRLRRGDPGLAPVVDRLHTEHLVIHEVLETLDRALVRFVDDAQGAELQLAVDQLSDTLLSHLAYEERELVEPIARLGVLV